MAMTHEQWRDHEFYRRDPYFFEIDPALLNSVDITKYVEKGCLVGTEEFDEGRVKTASYEMKLLGTLYDWIVTDGGKSRRRCREVQEGDKTELAANSITYLWMKETLFLPEYIAARFNLHIRYVHKGLLLGTGPLVDPGFSGRLLVPLHNLTDNNYVINGGDGVIWVEFTKLSRTPYWNIEGVDRPDKLKAFPVIKDLDTPDQYFLKSEVMAEGGVQSAYKGALDRVMADAGEARKSIGRITNIGYIAIVFGVFSVLGTIAGLWFTGYDLIYRATEAAQSAQNQVIVEQISDQKRKIEELQIRIEEMNNNKNSDKASPTKNE